MAKGGGSANKSFLFQATPSVLTKIACSRSCREGADARDSAASPYHLARVGVPPVAELFMKTVTLASGAISMRAPAMGRPTQRLPRS